MVTLTMNSLSTGELWLLAAIAIGLLAVISIGLYAWYQVHKPNSHIASNH